MPRLAANLSLLFTEVDFLARFEAAAMAGFKGVECQFPYAWPAALQAQQLARFGLTQVLINLPAGNWAAGERGIACLPDRVDEFRDSVALAIDYARELGCRRLHCLAGIVPPDLDPALASATYLDNLRHAAARLAEEGLTLLIEPINTFDIPGYYLTRTTQAEAVLGAVGADNLMIQYDVYHAQRSEGELANTIARLLPRIGHMQLADTPGRHEPGSGEINYGFLFDFIDRCGYTGWIGCEYLPAGDTLAGLSWRARYPGVS